MSLDSLFPENRESFKKKKFYLYLWVQSLVCSFLPELVMFWINPQGTPPPTPGNKNLVAPERNTGSFQTLFSSSAHGVKAGMFKNFSKLAQGGWSPVQTGGKQLILTAKHRIGLHWNQLCRGLCVSAFFKYMHFKRLEWGCYLTK